MAHSQKVLLGCALSLTACIRQDDATETDLVESESEFVEGRQGLRSHGGDYLGAVELDARRSLVVTEQPILARFSFERVMSQLASQARVRGLTATGLFQQWWDTQNPTSTSTFSGPHCDTSVDATLGPVVNGFPYSCRPAPAEGAQVSCNPFTDAACAYIPVGLFNRFDLAPADGSSCGEYRIVFAKTSGQTNARSRNLMIFEASMPNPSPRQGLAGCRPLVKFWADLSRIDDLEERAKRLEQLYFRGLGREFPAVVDIRNYGDNERGRGQVRTNQFMQDGLDARAWSLREFKLQKQCKTQARCGCSERDSTLRFVPVTDKTNPYGPLFSAASTHPQKNAFQRMFVDQVESLSSDELTGISMDIPDSFNSAQSQASGSTESNYLANFEDGGAFAESLVERLDELGATLEPVDIVARAQTQTCAGCHRISNGASLGGGLTWPASLGFTHVSEVNPETVNDVVRYRISDALVSTFLPRRAQVMGDFLIGRARRGHDRDDGRHGH